MQALFLASILVVSSRFVSSSPPEDLSNFQNEYVCDSDIRLVRPLSIADIQEAVKLHSNVVPVGLGHSWNKEFFCAASSSKGKKASANIVMTTIRPLMIDIDENEPSVWVSAGVTVWDLMVFLANYVTPSSPRGYAIAAPPSCVNHTIGGAIATNAHGSSLMHGSLSSQVLGFKVVLANGTLAEIYPDTFPLYFRAFQVSVGRLGVVTDVKLRIVPETPTHRKQQSGIPTKDFVLRLRDAQDQYRTAKTLPAWLNYDLMFTFSLRDYKFTTITLEPASEVMLPDKKRGKRYGQELEYSQPLLEALDVKMNRHLELSRRKKGRTIAAGVDWKKPASLQPDPRYSDLSNLKELYTESDLLTKQFFGNLTSETHKASFIYTEELAATTQNVLQDVYEVAVHVDKMADCIQGLINLLQTTKPDNGLRSSPMFRFVGKEEGLLSASSENPVLWIELTDKVYYNQGVRTINAPFKKLMEYLVTSHQCTPARLHWGKTGWPDRGCWHGADAFIHTWCDFGCVVRDLDPNDKFIGSAPDRWNWEGANFDECCSDFGYDYVRQGCGCNVNLIRAPSECPEAPFYSNH